VENKIIEKRLFRPSPGSLQQKVPIAEVLGSALQKIIITGFRASRLRSDPHYLREIYRSLNGVLRTVLYASVPVRAGAGSEALSA
jgi:hypothetical protein